VEGGVDGDLSADFLVVIIHRRIAVIDPAESADLAGGEQHGLGKRRLATVSVPYYCDIPD